MNPLSRILNDAMRRLDVADAALEARAVMLWPEIVGEQMARATEARAVRDGVLLLMVRSSEWGSEIGFLKPTLLKRYRERLGRDVVRGIRCTVGPVRGAGQRTSIQTPPEEEVRRIRLANNEIHEIREAAECEDTELSQAIRRALTREAQLRQWRLSHGAKACPRCGAAYRTPHDICPACRQEDATAGAMER